MKLLDSSFCFFLSKTFGSMKGVQRLSTKMRLLIIRVKCWLGLVDRTIHQMVRLNDLISYLIGPKSICSEIRRIHACL